jgi:hypothetical protein
MLPCSLLRTAAPPPPYPWLTPRSSSGVTVEYQRMRAKEMLKYFQDKKAQETVKDAR